MTRLEKLVTELSEGKRGAGFFQSKGKSKVTGDYPPIPIIDAIQWAKTSHGGKQFIMFDRPIDDPCARWGWCEV